MKDNGICRQNACLNPSLVLYFGNYESSKVSTKSVRNFQLVYLDRLCTKRRPVKK